MNNEKMYEMLGVSAEVYQCGEAVLASLRIFRPLALTTAFTLSGL